MTIPPTDDNNSFGSSSNFLELDDENKQEIDELIDGLVQSASEKSGDNWVTKGPEVVSEVGTDFTSQDGLASLVYNPMPSLQPEQGQLPGTLVTQASSRAYFGICPLQPDQSLATSAPYLYALLSVDYQSSKTGLDGFAEPDILDIQANLPMPLDYNKYLLILRLRPDSDGFQGYYWPFPLGRRNIKRDEAQYRIDHLNRRIAHISLAYDRANNEAGANGRIDERTGRILCDTAKELIVKCSHVLDPYLPGVCTSGEDLALNYMQWWEIRGLVVQPHYILCSEIDRRFVQGSVRWHMVRASVDALALLRGMTAGPVPEWMFKEF